VSGRRAHRGARRGEAAQVLQGGAGGGGVPGFPVRHPRPDGGAHDEDTGRGGRTWSRACR
ncbi:unnamed protein product, partial [Prorocentrum cordatum]